MQRMIVFMFGVASYLVFLVVFLYAIGFVGNVVVPKSIDSPPDETSLQTIVVDLLLLGLFAVPHSVMARPGFKRWWTRLVPDVLERSIYVLMSSVLLAIVFWQWRAMLGVVWEVSNPIGHWLLVAAFWGGWLFVLVSTFMVDHFDLFGLRQVYLYAVKRPNAPIALTIRGLNRLVRHPIMLGFLIAFWATPSMTVGHLVFAVTTTVYIVVALWFEERDLLRFYGEAYADYRRKVGMLLPAIRK